MRKETRSRLHKKTLGKVFLIHGFLRSSSSMLCVKKYLELQSWEVYNWGYPTRENTIEGHARSFIQDLLKHISPGEPVSFVTHSMGGLVLRAALNDPLCPETVKQGKAVLLAPPNRGAHWGRQLGRLPITGRLLKPYAGQQLITTHRDGFEYLGPFPPEMDLMIISGTLSLNPFIAFPNDGIIELEETYLPTTPCVHKTVKTSHSFILSNKSVMRYIASFLLHTR